MIVEFGYGSIASLQCLARRRSVHHNAAYYGRDRELHLRGRLAVPTILKEPQSKPGGGHAKRAPKREGRQRTQERSAWSLS